MQELCDMHNLFSDVASALRECVEALEKVSKDNKGTITDEKCALLRKRIAQKALSRLSHIEI